MSRTSLQADAVPGTDSEAPIAEALKTFGPLPPRFRPFFVDGCSSNSLKFEFSIMDKSKQRSFLVEHHPSSRDCFNMYTDHRSVPEPASKVSLDEPGFNRPPLEYIATDWIWEAQPSASRAIYEAIVNYSLLHGCSVPSVEAFARVERVASEQQQPMAFDTREQLPYHPCDTAFRLSADETDMAAIACRFGYALAIAQPMGGSEGPDLLDKNVWTKRQPPVKFRYAAAPYQELFPPIFVERYMGVWFSLVARDTEVVRSTIGEDVQPKEIDNIWASLHNIGLPLNVNGMLVLLAWLWQTLRLGLDVEDEHLTSFFIHAAQKLLAGFLPVQIVESFSPDSKNTPTILTNSLIDRIAMFSCNKIFRVAALKFEDIATNINELLYKKTAAKKKSPEERAAITKQADAELAALSRKNYGMIRLSRFQVAPPTVPHEVRDLLQPPSQPRIFASPEKSSSRKLRISMGYELWVMDGIDEETVNSRKDDTDDDSESDCAPNDHPNPQDDVVWTNYWIVGPSGKAMKGVDVWPDDWREAMDEDDDDEESS